MLTRRRQWLGLALALATTGAAAAQEAERLEPVVVTATKIETPAERLGTSVTVITGEELETYNYGRIEEALRRVPGVEVQRSGGPGKTTSIKIRGAGSQQVQVLVDGLRVGSPTLGTTDLADLTLDAIERIEIVRGPQSTLHGANAIGGVVNIITRRGRGAPQGALAVEGGSYDTFREQATAGGALGGFNWFLSTTREDSGGQFDNDDADRTAVAGRVGYDFPWRGELALSGRYVKATTDLPIDSTFPTTTFDPNSQQQTESWLYNLAYRQPVRPWWEVRLRYGQWWNNQGFQDPPPPAGDAPGTISQINTRRREFEMLHAFHLGPWATLTLGGDHRNERGRNRGAFRQEINTVSLFGQPEVRLFGDRIVAAGGLRWEDNDVFGDEVTPRMSVAVNVRETGTRLRGGWGKGFRAPTINDLFFPGFGNPELGPERSESYEAGFDQALWQRRLRVGGTYFHNEFRDLIQFVFDPVTFTFLPFNVAGARSQGVEAYLALEPLDWLALAANYTFTDTRDTTTGRDLRRFARHRWNADLTLTPRDGLTLFLQAHVVSSHEESASAGRTPGYHRLDVGGTYRLLGRTGRLDGVELTARVDNVTDEVYEEVRGFRALGWSALVGLRTRFR